MKTRISTPTLQLILLWALVLAGKMWYQRASIEELDFLLAPTAKGASLLLGLPFEASYRGYLNQQVGILISLGCSGFNFLLIATLAGFFALLPRWGQQAYLIPLCLLGAWALTLLANVARICCLVLAGSLVQAPGWLHMGIGATVYLSLLIPYSLLLSKKSNLMYNGNQF